ncbi:TPA: PBSX family phage terminase large subunit [Escherichia coli]
MTDNFYAPPHSIEAEQAVIGGLLLDDDSSERVQKVLAMLKPDSFYSRPHKILFEEITRMHREQKPVDGLTLFDELERKSLTVSVGGFAYIAEIAKNTPSAANIVAYAMQVRETAMERYAINRMTEATELLYSRNGMTATQKYEAIQSIFTQLTDHAKTGSRRGLRSFGEVMEDWVSDLEKRFDPSGEQRGMSTGIPSLDRMLSPKGLVKGSLFVIGARPKMGKTTLYSQMAINCAVHEKKPALMFSLEMPGDQILEKLVGQKSGVNPNIFYLPATNDADDGYQGDYDGDFNRAIETANRLSEIDLLYIDDTPGLSLAQIVSESRRIKREKGCVGMILVDYLTLMTAEKADRNDLAYGMITKGLKNLAKELDCVVVLLTQLNRALESRTNKRPLPSDSRDTGQIEQDCDYWVGIHREGAFDDSVPPGEAVTKESWDILIPTIRKPFSEIWVSFNPKNILDDTYQRFVVNPPDDICLLTVNYTDNPHFPEVLRLEMEECKRRNPTLYRHIWLGEPVSASDMAIIKREWLEAATDANKKLGWKAKGAVVSAHDPSDTGPDAKGYASRHGSVVKRIAEGLLMDINDGADWATSLAIEDGADHYLWDGDGVGAGLRRQTTEAFSGKKITATMFKGSESPFDEDAPYQAGAWADEVVQGDNVRTIGDVFRNKRAQFYYALADRLYLTYRAVVHGEYADPDDMLSFDKEAIGEKMLEKLFAELTQIQRKFNNNGKLELMTKVEMKQKLGIPSPNLADALMMCMHCPESAAQPDYSSYSIPCGVG